MKMKTFLFYLKRPIKGVRRIALAVHEKRHPDEPWLSQGSIAFLDSILSKDMKIFEWGSGRSTLWFAKRAGEVVSIEYSQEWSVRVEEMVKEAGARNAKVSFIPLDHEKSLPTPKDYDPLPKYVTELFKYPKESFDLIIVDGHYRLTCVDQCLEYIRPGGYILIDNSNRIPREEWVVPMEWPLVHESENVMTRTSLWRKPIENLS